MITNIDSSSFLILKIQAHRTPGPYIYLEHSISVHLVKAKGIMSPRVPHSQVISV